MTAPVRRPTMPGTVGDHEKRLRRIELGGERWIYVGTFPDDPNTTPDSPPFENGWTNVPGAEQVAFVMHDNQWVEIRGVPGTGTIGTVVFTLPAGYRPTKTTHFIAASTGGDQAFTWSVATNGEVTILAEIGAGTTDGIRFAVTSQTGEFLSVITTGQDPGSGFGVYISEEGNNNIQIRSVSNPYDGNQADIIFAGAGGQLQLNSNAPGGELVTITLGDPGGGGTGDLLTFATGDTKVHIQTVGKSFTIFDSSNNPIFRIDEDGSIHGLASVGAITWDL